MPASPRVLAAAAVALLAASSGAALAADTTYKAVLDGAANVPEAIKTPATGEVTLTVSEDGRSIRYVISVKDITNVAAADLHLGPPGANGPLVVKLFPVGGAAAKKGPFSGVLAQGRIDAGDLIGPMTGSGLDELLEQLQTGNAYINVHTNDGVDPANSGPGDYRLGEIRGQIER